MATILQPSGAVCDIVFPSLAPCPAQRQHFTFILNKHTAAATASFITDTTDDTNTIIHVYQ